MNRLAAAFRRLSWWLPMGSVSEISPQILATRIERAHAVQIIDVRSRLEFGRGHIASAVNVPLSALRRRLPDLGLDLSVPVVAVCLSAHRSIPAVRLLAVSGFQALQLQGGMNAWRSHGLPEVRS